MTCFTLATKATITGKRFHTTSCHCMLPFPVCLRVKEQFHFSSSHDCRQSRLSIPTHRRHICGRRHPFQRSDKLPTPFYHKNTDLRIVSWYVHPDSTFTLTALNSFLFSSVPLLTMCWFMSVIKTKCWWNDTLWIVPEKSRFYWDINVD